MKYRKVWLGGAIALTICAIGVAFAKPLNVANMLFRARAATYTGEKITFDRSNSTRSGTTNTTTGSTFTGGGIICKTYDNDTTQSNGYVGALKYGSSIRFYEPDGVTEYTFEDLESIRFFYSGAFGFYLYVTYVDGETQKLGSAGGQPYSTSTTGSSGRGISFPSATYKDVSNIWVDCRSDGTNVALFTKIEITYNCTSKHQTGIEITSSPTQTNYTEGESFNTAGMIVKATYSNSISIATTSYSVTPSTLSLSDTYVTISHNGFTATQAVTVTKKSEANLAGTYNYYSSGDTVYSYLTLNADGTGIYYRYPATYSLTWVYNADTGLTLTKTGVTGDEPMYGQIFYSSDTILISDSDLTFVDNSLSSLKIYVKAITTAKRVFSRAS